MLRTVTGRLRAMRILAGVMAVAAIGFGAFTIVFGVVSPAQEPHAFHNPIVASLLMVVSAPAVVAIARAPERSIRDPLCHSVGRHALSGEARLGTSCTSQALPSGSVKEAYDS